MAFNTDQAQGAHGRMQISLSTTFGSGSSVWLEFLSESITQTVAKVNSAGIRGTRTHCSERTRNGNVKVSGSIEFEVSRILFDNILYPVLGTAESSNVFDVAETIPDFYLLIDKRTEIVRVNECRAGKLTITSRQGETVRCTLEIEAESLTLAQSWPSDNYPERSIPYQFSDLGDVTIAGTARDLVGFECSVDNVLDTEFYGNSRFHDETISATDRIVNVAFDVLGQTANADLLNFAATGAAVSVVFTHEEETSSVLTLAFGRVAFEGGFPTIDGKGTKVFRIQGQSRGLKHPGESGASPDIRFTNAHA